MPHVFFMLVGTTHFPLGIKWKHMVGTIHPTLHKVEVHGGHDFLPLALSIIRHIEELRVKVKT